MIQAIELRQRNHLHTARVFINVFTHPSSIKRMYHYHTLTSDVIHAVSLSFISASVVLYLHHLILQPLPKQPSLHTTLQRHVRAHRNVHIPKFHFPTGKPGPPGHLETIRTRVVSTFATIGERAMREHFGSLAVACQLPLYWKTPLYLAACADKGSCTLEQFMGFWTRWVEEVCSLWYLGTQYLAHNNCTTYK